MSNIWFRLVKSILNTCDNPDGQITLLRKGVETAYIQPLTKEELEKMIEEKEKWKNLSKF